MKRWKQSVHNIFHTLAVIFRITPELFFLTILITLLNAVLPFVNLVFTQLILDEFMGFADHRALIIYAILAISLNVAILFFISILSKIKLESNAKFELRFHKILNFHQMNLSFQDIESNEVKELQRNIEQAKMRSSGFETVISKFEVIIKNIFNIVLASFSFLRIFSMHETVKQASFWTGPLPLLILLFLTILSIVFSFGLQVKQNEKIADLNEQANQANGGAFLYMQLISIIILVRTSESII